jgi:acyl dehydratase
LSSRRLAVGDKAQLSRVVSRQDVEAFANLSGDTNPLHLDDCVAAGFVFRKPIAHGMLVASQVSAVLGTRLPGPGSLYLSQNLNFAGAVFLGDEITAEVEVTEARGKGVYALATRCRNQAGELVLDGQAVVKVLRS